MTQELITALLANNDTETTFMLEDMLKEKIEAAIAHRKIELAATMMEDMDANGVIQLSPEQKRAKKAKDDHADAVADQNDKDSGDDQDDSDSSQSGDDQYDSDSDQDDASDDNQTRKPAFLKKDVKEAFRPDHKNGRAIGEFQEKDHGKWFTYRNTNNPWAKKHGLNHEIDVGPHGDVRFGNVKSTRAHIATDENDDGTPKLDTWHLKKHNRWQHNEDVELEEAKKQDRFHIVTKDGKPANLVSYASLSAAKADRDANHPGHIIHQVGPRGSVKHVFEAVEEISELSVDTLKSYSKKIEDRPSIKNSLKNVVGYGTAQKKIADKEIKEMAMDAIKHPTHGKIEWRNEGGAHMITTKGANGSMKIHAMGSHKEISAKWAKLKSKLMTEDINWISDK